MMTLMKITTTSPFFGGGQDFEQSIIADDPPAKKESIDNYIQNDGVVPGYLRWFPTIGVQYYVEASGRRIEGTQGSWDITSPQPDQ